MTAMIAAVVPDTFANTKALWGALLAIIPLVLYLLARRQARIVDWPAMRFFLRDIRRRTRWMRLAELLLLLTRMAILVGVAYLFARPAALVSQRSEQGSAGTSSVVILLDNSLSMNWRHDGASLIDRARTAARGIIDGRTHDDAIWIVPLAGAAGELRDDPLRDRFEAHSAVEEIAFEGGRVSVLWGLDLAADLLSTVPAETRGIFILSDLQRSGWELEDDARWNFVLDRIRLLLPPPAIHVVALRDADDRPSNTAIVSLDVARAIVGTDRAVEIVGSVQRFGEDRRTPGASLRVALIDDDLTVATRTVSPTIGKPTTVRFLHRFTRPGVHRLQLRMDGDELADDDTRRLVVEVVDRVPVLIVEGEGQPGRLGPDGELVDLALVPRAGEDVPPEVIFEPKSVAARNLFDTGALAAFVEETKRVVTGRLIVLSGVTRLDARAAEMVESFVARGGGLLVFLGDRTDLQSYNTTLYRDGRGILPARLVARRSSEVGVVPGNFRLDHPAFQPFTAGSRVDFDNIHVRQWVECEAPPAGATVLAEMPGKLPFILEKFHGHGRVIMVLSAPTRSAELPRRPVFVPLLHGFAQYLSRGRGPQRTIAAGDAMVVELDEEEATATDLVVSVERPDGSLKAIRIEARAPTLAETASIPGFHTIAIRAGEQERAETFAVNLADDESDLTTLDGDDVEKLTDVLGLTVHRNIDDNGDDFTANASEELQRHEHWPRVLAGVIVLVLLEMILGRQTRSAKVPTAKNAA